MLYSCTHVVTVGDKRVNTEKYRVPSSKARPSVTMIGLYVGLYDTKDEFNRKWTQKLSDQLNLAHVARKNTKKKNLKQTHASAHLVQYRFKI